MHPCSQQLKHLSEKHFVAHEILGLLRSQPNMTPVNIVNEMQCIHCVQISYKVAWEARKVTQTIINGNHEDSYAAMPSYHEQLLEANPGSLFTLERTATNQFHRLFLCYYASAKFASRAKRGEYDEELIMEQLALNRSFFGDEGLG